jgi:hypothetical protein
VYVRSGTLSRGAARRDEYAHTGAHRRPVPSVTSMSGEPAAVSPVLAAGAPPALGFGCCAAKVGVTPDKQRLHGSSVASQQHRLDSICDGACGANESPPARDRDHTFSIPTPGDPLLCFPQAQLKRVTDFFRLRSRPPSALPVPPRYPQPVQVRPLLGAVVAPLVWCSACHCRSRGAAPAAVGAWVAAVD